MANLDDLTQLTDEELVAAHIEAREAKRVADVEVAAELARRGRSWRAIGRALGVDHTTAYGWVRDAGRLPPER